MEKPILWSLDTTTPEEAKKICDKVASKMENPVVMALLIDSSLNPVALSDVVRQNMHWEKQEHGWLFCKEGELKWRRLHDRSIRFVYLGNDDDFPDGAKAGKLGDLCTEKSQLVAWGLFDQGECYEESIDQRIRYPLTEEKPYVPGKWLAFKIYKYIEPGNGELRFWRHYAIGFADRGKSNAGR